MAESGANLQTGSMDVERFALETLRETWEVFKRDPALYILAMLVVAGASVVTLGVLAGPLSVGFIRIVERRRRDESASVGDVFDGFSDFGSALLAFVLVTLAALIGSLFVVGAVLVIFGACFTFHEIAYRRTHAIEAIQASWDLARHHVLHVLLLLLGLTLLGAAGGIGLIVCVLSLPFSLVLSTVAYEKLTAQTPDRSLRITQV